MPQNWWELFPEAVPSPAARPRSLPGSGGVVPGPPMTPQPASPDVAFDPGQPPLSAFDPSYYLPDEFTSDDHADRTPVQPASSGAEDIRTMDRNAVVQMAAAAIQRGAGPDAVRARLHEMGHIDLDPASPFSDLIPDDARSPGITGHSGMAMPAEPQATAQRQGDPEDGTHPAANLQKYGGNLQRRSDPAMASQKSNGPAKLYQSAIWGQVNDRMNEIGRAVFGRGNRPANPPANAAGLNGYGYVPQRGDENLLARFLFAEFSRSDNWRDMPAGAWSAINRIRPNGHWPRYRTMDTIGTSLLDVLNKRGRDGTLQYSWLPPGGVGALGGSPQWQASARPQALTGSDRQAWMWAVDTARRVLGGVDADRTGGATYFHNRSVGIPPHVGGWFGTATTIARSPYRSPNDQNFFYRHLEDPVRPIPWRPGGPQRR